MEVGLYGKLPSHGDFLRRRVSDAFVRVWDEWLQQSVAASRAALGRDWLDIYLTSPAWRFACDAGVCGPRGYAGVMVPSVDRVGRYFPLTVACEVPPEMHSLRVAQLADGWLSRVEHLMVITLREEHVDLEKFDRHLVALGSELDRLPWSAAPALDLEDAALLTGGARGQWQLALGEPPAFGALVDQLLYARLRQTHGPVSVFWTEGSARIEPSCLVLGGLPPPDTAAALLRGRWDEAGWRTVKSKPTAPTVSRADGWPSERSLRFRSSAMTDIGQVRRTNQDAFIERAEIGVWAMADGMGGHEHGECASRMICDGLAALMPATTLNATVAAIIQQLRDINDCLCRAVEGGMVFDRCASTVAALVTRGARYAVLWAGDSRVYRLRGGQLMQLTTDHVADSGETHAISRAVGGETSLDLDAVYGLVEPGDRFLLCSDGLNHELSDGAIAQLLVEPDRARCMKRLIAAALQAGGKDNISVIIVDADEPS